LGGALGVAICSTIVNSSLTALLPQRMPQEYAINVIDSSLYIRHGLPSEYFEAAIESYAIALKLMWCVMTGLSGIGVVSSIFIKHRSLKKDKPAERLMTAEANMVLDEKEDGNDTSGTQEVVIIKVLAHTTSISAQKDIPSSEIEE
jgi:hypothetical protein